MIIYTYEPGKVCLHLVGPIVTAQNGWTQSVEPYATLTIHQPIPTGDLESFITKLEEGVREYAENKN